MQTCLAPLGVVCGVSSDGCPSCSNKLRRTGLGRKRAPAAVPLRVDLSGCKYELLRLVAARLGWVVVGAGDPADLVWTDTSISCERLAALGPTQRINHFHGMLALCRKAAMARLLTAMAAAAPPGAYAFAPPAWLLPAQLPALLADAKSRGRQQTYIIKPDAGCQGRGIALVQGGPRTTLLKALAGLPPAVAAPAVAQHYLSNPALIGGHKYDLRLYVLVAGVDPLRVYLYEEGLVRFATRPYAAPAASNLATATMHLTNYAVNKAHAAELSAAAAAAAVPIAAEAQAGAGGSGCSMPPQDGLQTSHSSSTTACSSSGPVGVSGTKWSLAQLRAHLEAQGADWPRLWASISCLVVKSLLAVAPALAAAYTTSLPRNSIMDRSGAAAGPGGSSSSMLRPEPQGRGKGSGAGGGLSSAAVAGAAGSRCFEVLGFDVLLDAGLHPWLVEVNHSPSFNIDTPLDRAIKEALLVDTLHLMRVDGSALRAAKTAARRAAQARLMTPAAAGAPSSSHVVATSHNSTSSNQGTTEDLRAALTRAQDKWEVRHAGGFTRVYPAWPPHIKAQPSGATSSSSGSSSITQASGVCGANAARGSCRIAPAPAPSTLTAEQAAADVAQSLQQQYEELLDVAHKVWQQLPAASAIRSNGGYDTVAAAAAAAMASGNSWTGKGSTSSKSLRVALAKKTAVTAGREAGAMQCGNTPAASTQHDGLAGSVTPRQASCSSTNSEDVSSSQGGSQNGSSSSSSSSAKSINSSHSTSSSRVSGNQCVSSTVAKCSSRSSDRPSVLGADVHVFTSVKSVSSITDSSSSSSSSSSNRSGGVRRLEGNGSEASALHTKSTEQNQQQQQQQGATSRTSPSSGRIRGPRPLPLADQGPGACRTLGTAAIGRMGGGHLMAHPGAGALPSSTTGPAQKSDGSRPQPAAPTKQHFGGGETCQASLQQAAAGTQQHTLLGIDCQADDITSHSSTAADHTCVAVLGSSARSANDMDGADVSPDVQHGSGPHDAEASPGTAGGFSRQHPQQPEAGTAEDQGPAVPTAGSVFAGVEAMQQLLQQALATGDLDPWEAQLAAAISSTRLDKGRRPWTTTGGARSSSSSSSSAACNMAQLASRLQCAQPLVRRPSALTARPITAPTGGCRSRQQEACGVTAAPGTPTQLSSKESSRRTASAGGSAGAKESSTAGSSCATVAGTDDRGSCSDAQHCIHPVPDVGTAPPEVPAAAPVAHLTAQQQRADAAAAASPSTPLAQPAGNQPPMYANSRRLTPAISSGGGVAAISYRSSSNQAVASVLHGAASRGAECSSRLVLPVAAQLPPLTCSRATGAGPISRTALVKPQVQAAAGSSCGPHHQQLLNRLLTRDAGLIGSSRGSGSGSPLSVAGLQARPAGKLHPGAAGATPLAAAQGGAARRSSGGCDVLPYTDRSSETSVDVGKQGSSVPLSSTMADVRVRRFPSFHPIV